MHKWGIPLSPWETSLSVSSLALKMTLIIIEIRLIFALFFRVESRARVVFITSHIFRQTHTHSLSLFLHQFASLSLSLSLPTAPKRVYTKSHPLLSFVWQKCRPKKKKKSEIIRPVLKSPKYDTLNYKIPLKY